MTLKLPRFRIRTFMILVALTALAIAAPGEYRDIVKRSNLSGWASYCRMRAKLADRERAVCLAMDGRVPYDGISRDEHLIDSDFWAGIPARSRFTGWAQEAAWHEARSKDFNRRASAAEVGIRESGLSHRILWIFLGLLPVLVALRSAKANRGRVRPALTSNHPAF